MKKLMTVALSMLLLASLLAGCAGIPNSGASESPAATAEATVAPSETPTAQPTEAAESPADTAGEDASALAASLGATSYEAITGWPDGLPAEVPEFNAGTFQNDMSFKMEIQGITAYAMSYRGVTQENIDAYTQAMQSNGFTVSNADANGIATYTGMILNEDGSMTMIVMMSLGQDIFMVEVMPNVKAAS
jgi:hypothetical protein